MPGLPLVRRTLLHHLPANVMVALGCAIGAASLTGALLVGDSMRGSLKAMALGRLGPVTDAIVSTRFLKADLDRRFEGTFSGTKAASVVSVEGSVQFSGTGKTVRANLLGVTERYWSLMGASPPEGVSWSAAGVRRSPGVLNAELAGALGVKVGDRVLLQVEKRSSIPRESLVGVKSVDKSILTMAIDVTAILPDDGPVGFSLRIGQRIPKNLLLPAGTLAKLIDQPDRANQVLVAGSLSPDGDARAVSSADLRVVVSPDDLGVSFRGDPKLGVVTLESRGQILEPYLEEVAERQAASSPAPAARVFTYLANAIRVGERSIHYSVVSGIAPVETGAAEPAALIPGGKAIAPGEIILNEHARERLGAKLGDRVILEYFLTGAAGELSESKAEFKLVGVVPLSGIAADPGYAPPFPGITDAKTMSAWDPPFPMDLKKIAKPDEEYWDRHRTTPKAFVSHADAARLWSTRFGSATSLRMGVATGGADLKPDVEARERMLCALIDPGKLGVDVFNIRGAALAASGGSTDFGGLFLAFSFFLIVAAGLLTGLLFRLNAERRASQSGLLLAVGLEPAKVRRLVLAEGLALALVGAALGLIGAFGYAWLMVTLLTTWWRSAISTPFIHLHLSPMSFLIGGVASTLVSLLAMWLASRKLTAAPIPRLLRPGFQADEPMVAAAASASNGKSTRRGWLGPALVAAGLATLLVPLAGVDPVGPFFGGAALLLAGSLTWFFGRVRQGAGGVLRGRGLTALVRLAAGNAGRHPGRTALTAGLIGFASFTVVAVGLMRHAPVSETPDRNSANGGFTLIAETASPLVGDLGLAATRFDLGLQPDEEKRFAGKGVFGFRVRDGEEAGCLNVYQPKYPMLLGVTDRFLERGGFRFASTLASDPEERANPWRLLHRRFDDGAIPAIGDAATLQWSLKTPVGSDLELTTGAGRTVRLRFVGGLAGSVFPGQVLISERDMLEHFPATVGYRYFLLEAGPGERAEVESSLARMLEKLGVETETTWGRIAAYKAVENTYMAAFSILGGLGLALGTLGLGAVLARNVLERRGELGLLRAIGFSRADSVRLVSLENLLLLVAGLALGGGCALIAVLPTLLGTAEPVSWAGLGITMGAVVVAGLVAVCLAARTSLGGSLVAALRSE